MTTQGYSDIMIERIGDNRLRLSSAGKMPAGSIATNPQWIRVSGPTMVIPATDPMTEEEYSQWRANLEAKGFTVITTDGPFA